MNSRLSSLPKRVFDFWFSGELSLSQSIDPAIYQKWFGAEKKVDEEIRDRFLEDHRYVCDNFEQVFEKLTSDAPVRRHNEH